MVLMLQREAGARYTADPGTRSYGAISIFLQASYDFTPGYRVAASCFHPRPDVDSSLQVFERRPRPFRFSPEVKALVRRCFQQRRKQLGAFLRLCLRANTAEAWLAELETAGFGLHARAEQIPVALWQKLRVT